MQRWRPVVIALTTSVGLTTASAALSGAGAAPNTYVIRPPQQATATTPRGNPPVARLPATGAKRVNIPNAGRGSMMPAPSATSKEEAGALTIDPAPPMDEHRVAVGIGCDEAQAVACAGAIAFKGASPRIFDTGAMVADVEGVANGTFAAMSVAAVHPPAPQSTASARTSDASGTEAVPVDPHAWRSAGWLPRVTYSAQRIAHSTVGLRRVSASGDANVTLALAGIDASTARSAARALATVTPATLDRRVASIELVHGRTEDGQVRLLTATITDRRSRGEVWWFAPKGQPEGFFDDNGKRVGDSGMALPIVGSHISSPFGTRYRGHWAAFHNGIDVAGQYGTPIIAAADGVVDYTGWYYDYGKTVRIVHSDSLATSYSHMSDFAPGVGPGTRVHKDRVIGYVGSTGRSTGPHLHFCVLVDGHFVNPEAYVADDGGRLSPQDLVSFRAWQRATAGMANEASTHPRATLANGFPRVGIPQRRMVH